MNTHIQGSGGDGEPLNEVKRPGPPSPKTFLVSTSKQKSELVLKRKIIYSSHPPVLEAWLIGPGEDAVQREAPLHDVAHAFWGLYNRLCLLTHAGSQQ